MNNTLFIGNGLNRTLKNSIAWSDLLEGIADELKVSYYSDNPMPLEFERIINEYLNDSATPTSDVYKEVKNKIINKLKMTKLPDNSIHKDLNSIKISNIITTNYDYLLEYVFDSAYQYKGDKKKYLLEKTSTQKGVNFYHPHGMIASPQSICLGYEHYVGIAQKIRYEINHKDNNDSKKMSIKLVLYDEREQKNTWCELFYTSNISMLGFALDNCELDFWWLITHRAYLYYSNHLGLKEKIKNNITFYDIIDDVKLNNVENEVKRYKRFLQQQLKHQLLKNNHIVVKTYNLSECDNSYEVGYNQIIKDIKENT